MNLVVRRTRRTMLQLIRAEGNLTKPKLNRGNVERNWIGQHLGQKQSVPGSDAITLVETAWPAPVRHERCLQLLAITRSCCRKPRACIDMQNNGEIAASKTRAFVGPWTRLFMVWYAVITRHKSAKDGCNCLYRTWYETMPSPVRLLMWLCPLWQLSGGLPAGAGIRQQMRDKVQSTCYGCFRKLLAHRNV